MTKLISTLSKKIKANHLIQGNHGKRSLTTAFIGLGNMGLEMSRNLVEKSSSKHDDDDDNNNSILLYDKFLPESLLLPQNSNSTQVFTSLEDLVSSVQGDIDVVITVLPSDAAVKEVILDVTRLQSTFYDTENEAISVTTAGTKGRKTLFIDSSTISPSTTRELHNIISERSGQMSATIVDAPMSGGVNGAKNGTLTFMVGSHNDETFEQAKKTLLKMGNKVVRCGDVGMGGAAKLCNNLALGVQMVGICEAMLLGEEFGIDPLVLASVMNSSTAKCWSSEINNPHPDVAALTDAPASKQYGGGFSVDLMLKDIGLAVDYSSTNSSANLPLSSSARQLYSLAKSHGHDKQDFGVIFEFLKGNEKR